MKHHLVGLIAVWDPAAQRDVEQLVRNGLASFTDNHGEREEVVVHGEVALGVRIPVTFLPLTTWSLYRKGSSFCFVTGAFYEAYNGYSPKDGADGDLARIILDAYQTDGEKAIAHLNGSFSGVIWDGEKQIAVTFVDRLGIQTVYWTHIDGMTIISTNLAALRLYRKFAFDEISVFQYLVLGFPLLERTLFRHIFLQDPCTCILFSKSGEREKRRYYSMPGRGRRWSLVDSAVFLHDALQKALCRIAERIQAPLYLALSGGHDSRLILSALFSSEIPFEVVHWQAGDFNDTVAQKLCRMVGKPPHLVSFPSGAELRECHEAGFLYSEGSHSTHWGFFSLGKTAWLNGGTNLLTGFAADMLSGGLTIPDPARIRSFQSLCMAVWDYQARFFTFTELKDVFPDFSDEVEKTIWDEWQQTFRNFSDIADNFTDMTIWQRLTTRNFKGVRFAMIPIVGHVQWIAPALDNGVFDAYLSLPLDHLYLQQAHCLAAYLRNPTFGQLPACGWPIPLKIEATVPALLYYCRMLHKYSKKFRPTWLRRPKKVDDQIPVSLLEESFPLRTRRLERVLSKSVNGRGCYHQLLTLKRVCDVYVNGSSQL